jgi:hypothetical protein
LGHLSLGRSVSSIFLQPDSQEEPIATVAFLLIGGLIVPALGGGRSVEDRITGSRESVDARDPG